MQDVRGWKRLERRLAAVPAHAEVCRQPREVPRRGVVLQVRGEQPPASLEDLRGSRRARAREERGDDAALRGPAWVKEFRLRAVDPAFENSRREAAADAGGARRLAGVELQKARGEIGDAERREEPGRMEAAPMELTRRDAAGAARDLVAEGDGRDQLAAGDRRRV